MNLNFYPHSSDDGNVIAVHNGIVNYQGQREKLIKNAIHIGMIGCACSVSIELTQYFTGRGLFEFDDIFHNTLGAVIGYIIMKKITCSNRQGE